ncbi:aromatic acid exporter family protein [Aureibacillus halotolerans]|nr:aromatic acid exporter family protein [Aureibacillus halotolerans]
MYRIGYRTIKTAVGTAVAIALAQGLGLPNATSAGILAILCIKPSQKKTVVSSLHRFVACLLGILFSFVFFEGLGYSPVVIGLLLLFFIPITVMLRVEEGIITSSVIILHMYLGGNFTWLNIWQEVQLISVGIGMALLMNVYSPKNETSLKEIQQKLEAQYSQIFIEIAAFFRDGRMDWNGEEITLAAECIRKGKELSLRNAETYTFKNRDHYYHYFTMRDKQFDILERILPTVSRMTVTVRQGDMIADFLTQLSVSVHPGNTAHVHLERLEKLKESLKRTPLPVNREEFEVRALLYYFITEMERYLDIKKEFKALKDISKSKSKRNDAREL